MNLETEDLIYLCEFAIEAANKAGTIISKRANDTVQVNHKANAESLASQVVTEVDLLSEKAIVEILKPTLEKFDLGLLTEESEDNGDRLQKDYFWCVDPLDGTLPFIEKTPGYSVAIALVSKSGDPKIGLIYDPKEKILYHAIKGVGAFKNEETWVLKPSSKPSPKLLWYMDRSMLNDIRFDIIKEELENFAKSRHQSLEMVQIGGGALNACWVLEQDQACYLKLPKPTNGGGSLWDYSASACIHQCIEGHATDIFGNPLDLNRPDSTYLNHRGVLYCNPPELASDLMELSQRIYKAHPDAS